MTRDARGASPYEGLSASLVALVWICTLIEVLLSASDYRLFGNLDLRRHVFNHAAFWPGLLVELTPRFPLQDWTMFVTYGFLHAGPVHLIVNMLALISLAPPVLARVGPGNSALLYLGSLIGGSVGFALLTTTDRPMVGASGALFGLAGAALVWELSDRFALQKSLWPVIRAMLILAILNIVLYYVLGGLLAWEAHLGGFIAGVFYALTIGPGTRTE